MIESLRNVFAIPDLRKRVLFTFAVLAIYRLGAFIPAPGVDPVAIAEFTDQAKGTLLGFLNLFSGGALGRMTIFALGIMPYITASIILQLLTVVWPYLEKLSKEGELGRKKITQYTRYGTVLLSVVQSLGISFFLERTSAPGGAALVPAARVGLPLADDDLIDDWNGVRHVARRADHRAGCRQRHLADHLRWHRRRPSRGNRQHFEDLRTGSMSIITAALFVIFAVVVVGAIVLMERAQTPYTGAVRQAGRRPPGLRRCRAPTCPLRLNTGGVIPVIFAASILSFPQTIGAIVDNPSSSRR